jgi:hypothetical protein
VCVKIPVRDNYNLFIGNHYFAPEYDVKIVENYLKFLGVDLYSRLYQVVMSGNFEVSNRDRFNGTCVSVIITVKLKEAFLLGSGVAENCFFIH